MSREAHVRFCERFRGETPLYLLDLPLSFFKTLKCTEDIGTVIFDLICTADNGERFIIEVQRS